MFSQKSPGTAKESGRSRLRSPSSAQNGLPQRTQHHRGVLLYSYIYNTQMQKKCVVHIDSLTRHPPGCQSAVILFYFGLPAAEWIDRPPRETQPALHDGN